MLIDRFLDLLRKLHLQVGALLVVYLFCSAAHSCHILIQSNDAFAAVSVDGQSLGFVPQKIECSKQSAFVMVQSRLGQKFSRVVPEREKFNSSLHGLWNVNFPLHAVGEEARVLVATMASRNRYGSEVSFHEQRLVREISLLKNHIRNLTGQTKVKRRISSLNVESKKLRGWYLQLHSFKEDSWDMPSISSEVRRSGFDGGNQRLQVCLKNQKQGNPWTRVYWGPFSNEQEAKVAAKEIPRQTLLVADPNCQFNE